MLKVSDVRITHTPKTASPSHQNNSWLRSVHISTIANLGLCIAPHINKKYNILHSAIFSLNSYLSFFNKYFYFPGSGSIWAFSIAKLMYKQGWNATMACLRQKVLGCDYSYSHYGVKLITQYSDIHIQLNMHHLKLLLKGHKSNLGGFVNQTLSKIYLQ